MGSAMVPTAAVLSIMVTFDEEQLADTSVSDLEFALSQQMEVRVCFPHQ